MYNNVLDNEMTPPPLEMFPKNLSYWNLEPSLPHIGCPAHRTLLVGHWRRVWRQKGIWYAAADADADADADAGAGADAVCLLNKMCQKVTYFEVKITKLLFLMLTIMILVMLMLLMMLMLMFSRWLAALQSQATHWLPTCPTSPLTTFCQR